MLGFVEALGEEDVDDEDAAKDEAEEAAGGGHQQQDPLLQLHTARQSINEKINDVNKVLPNTGIRRGQYCKISWMSKLETPSLQ